MRDFALSNALGADDLRELVAWRHEAHRHPELSGEEEQTAGRVCAMLARAMPDRIISGLGGHGVAAIFDSGKQGPTIMFRSELDALPIEELGGVAHRSLDPGKAHLCGHDGHSAILLGLGKLLGRQRPERGRVVLMFQPAEEDGSGAAAVIADPRYGEIRPDYAFALHNMPGFPMGEAYLSEGPANCASRGVRIELTGSTAHASQPEAGRSPMRAVAELMPRLEEAGNGGQPRPGYALVTVTHASMGAASYGVAPGHAEIRATLRTLADDGMSSLCGHIEMLARASADRHGLACLIEYADIFLACTNDRDATALLREGMDLTGVKHHPKPVPQRGSEDFGRFGAASRAAMLFLGAGVDTPKLHTPVYDFPDELIPIGIRIFAGTLSACIDRAVSNSR